MKMKDYIKKYWHDILLLGIILTVFIYLVVGCICAVRNITIEIVETTKDNVQEISAHFVNQKSILELQSSVQEINQALNANAKLMVDITDVQIKQGELMLEMLNIREQSAR